MSLPTPAGQLRKFVEHLRSDAVRHLEEIDELQERITQLHNLRTDALNTAAAYLKAADKLEGLA